MTFAISIISVLTQLGCGITTYKNRPTNSMDFLDPRRKKVHRRQLFIGYALMSILIAMSTLLILYLAYGYDIDRKTGTLIQNGIVFVDSKPGGASITVNDVPQRTRTNSRLVLPAGVYTLKLEAEGYRTWERTFMLEGGQIQRLVYPFLIPNNLVTRDIEVYDAQPLLASQSPDRRWVIVQKPGQTYLFDVFDLADPDKAPAQLVMPVSVLTKPGAEAVLRAVEWSNDNRHVLIERTFEGNREFIILDRENQAGTINVNTALGITPAEVSLRDKKPDQLYYLDALPGTLRSANLGNRTISAPLAAGVIDYKTYSDNIVLFATQADVIESGKTEFRVLENDKTYTLKSVDQADAYVMDVARYESRWYYVVGSAANNMAFVYENPLPALKQVTATPLIVTAILRLDNPRFVSFSANTQFIALQSGNQFLAIDLEDNRQYRTKLSYDIPVSQEIKWMDGHRLLFTNNAQSYIVDFDGSNEQTLVTSRLNPGPFFDRDFDNVLTFEDSKQTVGKAALTITVIED